MDLFAIPVVLRQVVDVINTMCLLCFDELWFFKPDIVIVNPWFGQVYESGHRNSTAEFFRREGLFGTLKFPCAIHINDSALSHETVGTN